MWWAFWLIYLLLSNFEGRLSLTASGRDDGGVVPGLDIVIALAGIVGLVLWIRVVLGVTRVQGELAGRSPAPGPLPPGTRPS